MCLIIVRYPYNPLQGPNDSAFVNNHQRYPCKYNLHYGVHDSSLATSYFGTFKNKEKSSSTSNVQSLPLIPVLEKSAEEIQNSCHQMNDTFTSVELDHIKNSDSESGKPKNVDEAKTSESSDNTLSKDRKESGLPLCQRCNI